MARHRKIKTVNELAGLAAGRTVYVRYSRSIARDIKRGYSLDHSQMSREPGLSAMDIRPDDWDEGRGWIARLLVSYGHLRYDGARAYVLTGEVAGKTDMVESAANYSRAVARWREDCTGPCPRPEDFDL